MTLFSYKNLKPELEPDVFVAPTAQIIGNVQIKKQSSVWFNTVLRGDMDKIRVGAKTNIQDLCVCHADENIPLTIGNKVTIGHRCVIHGCTIEDNCLIGMGSIVMNNAVIGEGSVIAAGTLILEKTIIPPFSLVTGSPGKVKKTYKDRSKIQIAINTMSKIYMETAQNYDSNQSFYEIKE